MTPLARVTSNPDQEPDAAAADRRQSLDRTLVRGLAWTGAARAVTQALSWLSTLVVARLLDPADYGVFGMAMVVVGFVQLFAEIGLGSAIVQRREMPRDDLARLGGLAALVGLGLAAATLTLAPPIAAFFREPRVAGLLAVMGLAFLASGFQVLPYGLLTRDLRFDRAAIIDGLESVVFATTTLTLAVLGFRFWALGLGFVAGKIVAAVAAAAACPHPLAWPRRLGDLRDAIQLGGHVVGSRLAWYLYSNADFFVVGRLLGTAPLGAYTIGWNIASIPVDKVSAVAGRVTLPVFSAVQRDNASVARYLKAMTEGLAVITLPISVGLCLVAPALVGLVLGPRWQPAVVPLQILSAYASVRALLTLYPQVLIAIGDARRNFRVALLLAAVMPVAFIVGARWGTTGVALAWVVAYPVVAIPMVVRYTLRRLGVAPADFVTALVPALAGTAAMVPVQLAVHQFAPSAWPEAVRLVLEVTLAGATYALVLFTGFRARLRALTALFRSPRPAVAPGA